MGTSSESVIDQSDVERDLDKTRIRIIGARAVWATWARQQADRAAEDGDTAAGDAEWRGLSVIDDALRRAETELETAIRLLDGLQEEGAPGRSAGLTHLHGTSEPGWREHNHMGGGIPHEHDPETSFQIPLGEEDER